MGEFRGERTFRAVAPVDTRLRNALIFETDDGKRYGVRLIDDGLDGGDAEFTAYLLPLERPKG
jgi:hypothetical protein